MRGLKPGSGAGGNAPGEATGLSDLLNVRKASPSDGSIRIVLNPTKEAKVEDLIQIRAELDGQGVEYEQCFWVRIVDEEKPKETTKKEEETKQENFGLPQPKLVYQEKKEGFVSWEDCGNGGIEMDYSTVVHPVVTGEQLEAIYINMDSHVLKSHKGHIKSITEEQIKLAVMTGHWRRGAFPMTGLRRSENEPEFSKLRNLPGMPAFSMFDCRGCQASQGHPKPPQSLLITTR